MAGQSGCRVVLRIWYTQPVQVARAAPAAKPKGNLMRRSILHTLVLSLPLLACCTLIASQLAVGCGSTVETPKDAAADVALDSRVATDARIFDAAPDVGEQCAVDGSVRALEVPDASLDGGFATGDCVSCLKTKCDGELTACDAECDCRTGIFSFLDCAPKNPSPSGVQGCLLRSFATASPVSQSLGFCASQKCAASCIPAGLSDAGRDAP